jgi:hypothetical protein
VATEEGSGSSISGIMQQVLEDLLKWLRDQSGMQTHEGLAGIILPGAIGDAVRVVDDHILTERSRVLEAHRRRLRGDQNALDQALNERQRRLQTLSERIRDRTLARAEGKFVAAGRIVDESGAGLTGVRVRAFDLERKHEYLLRETRTDMMGYYRLEYDESDFKDLADKKPEMYIEVLDEEGQQVHTSTKSFIHKAGEVWVIDVTLDASKVPRSQALSEMITRLMADQVRSFEHRKQALDSRMALRLIDTPATDRAGAARADDVPGEAPGRDHSG